MTPAAHLSAATPQRAQARVRSRALGVLLLAGATALSIMPEPARADAGSRGEAIEQALAKSGGSGKVLGVSEQRGDDGRVTYLVKVLTNGRVRVVRINGR